MFSNHRTTDEGFFKSKRLEKFCKNFVLDFGITFSIILFK